MAFKFDLGQQVRLAGEERLGVVICRSDCLDGKTSFLVRWESESEPGWCAQEMLDAAGDPARPMPGSDDPGAVAPVAPRITPPVPLVEG